jgi:hypothetical protein
MDFWIVLMNIGDEVLLLMAFGNHVWLREEE